MASAPGGLLGGGILSAHSLIGNAEVPGRGGSRAVVNPATGATFASVSLLDEAQAVSALEGAAAAFPAWAALSFAERGRFLLRVRDLLLEADEDTARLIAREQGKPTAEAQLAELFPSLESIRHLALHAEDVLRADPIESQVLLFAHKESRLEYVPLGVVLVITPWNYPF
ncbi:MAG TPA: aldehyde dehydrogenase family protein, partial [Vicinamibacteria bacterium]|nr:aldehyde dehydrogenase family protein [Vicinamibacteria bacterium]